METLRRLCIAWVLIGAISLALAFLTQGLTGTEPSGATGTGQPEMNYGVTADCPRLEFTSPPSLPDAVLGENYALHLQTTGGHQPVRLRVTGFRAAGPLDPTMTPPGLSMSLTGLLEGRPLGSGHYCFRVWAEDSCPSRSQHVSQQFHLAVNRRL